jgi:hypothetical protein
MFNIVIELNPAGLRLIDPGSLIPGSPEMVATVIEDLIPITSKAGNSTIKRGNKKSKIMDIKAIELLRGAEKFLKHFKVNQVINKINRDLIKTSKMHPAL